MIHKVHVFYKYVVYLHTNFIFSRYSFYIAILSITNDDFRRNIPRSYLKWNIPLFWSEKFVRTTSVLVREVVNCILGACPCMTSSRHALSRFLRVCVHSYEHCSGTRSLTSSVVWACGLSPLLLLVFRRPSFSFPQCALLVSVCSRSCRLQVLVLRQRESYWLRVAIRVGYER